MPLPAGEPTTAEAAQRWIEQHSGPRDRFGHIAQMYERHRSDYFYRLLKPGGLLISANLFLARFAADPPGLEEAAEYREQSLKGDRWLTASSGRDGADHSAVT